MHRNRAIHIEPTAERSTFLTVQCTCLASFSEIVMQNRLCRKNQLNKVVSHLILSAHNRTEECLYLMERGDTLTPMNTKQRSDDTSYYFCRCNPLFILQIV